MADPAASPADGTGPVPLGVVLAASRHAVRTDAVTALVFTVAGGAALTQWTRNPWLLSVLSLFAFAWAVQSALQLRRATHFQRSAQLAGSRVGIIDEVLVVQRADGTRLQLAITARELELARECAGATTRGHR